MMTPVILLAVKKAKNGPEGALIKVMPGFNPSCFENCSLEFLLRSFLFL